MKTAGPLQKLLHLANAREALRSGDLVQALNEVDAAVAADATFAAAQTLRADIVARMNAAVVLDYVAAVPVASPVAAVAEAPQPIMTPPVVVKPLPRARQAALKRTSIPIALGILVVSIGVSVALVASGIVGRDSEGRPRVVARASAAKPVLPSDVVLPTPPRAVTAAAGVAPQLAPPVSRETSADAMEWASPRLTHLNVRPRWRASALHVEDAALLKDLGQGIGELWVGKLTGDEDVIFLGGSIDENDWTKLRASLKPSGVVWRIYSNRSGSASDATPVTGAAAAGFSRVKKVRYSSDYSGEQFALRRTTR
jgi:hypothetical protein